MATRIGRPSKCGSCGECARCRWAAYMRQWYAGKTPEQRRQMRASRNPNLVREQDRRKQARRRLRGTPEQRLKICARDEVRKAKLRGDLVPGPCALAGGGECGGGITAHHADYTKPLDVVWVCRRHHAELHA